MDTHWQRLEPGRQFLYSWSLRFSMLIKSHSWCQNWKLVWVIDMSTKALRRCAYIDLLWNSTFFHLIGKMQIAIIGNTYFLSLSMKYFSHYKIYFTLHSRTWIEWNIGVFDCLIRINSTGFMNDPVKMSSDNMNENTFSWQQNSEKQEVLNVF